MLKRFAGMAAALLAAISFLPFHCAAVSAHSALVMDAQTGRVLYEKNAQEKSLIASCTKIMTALVVCEQTNVLDRVRIPKEAVGIEGSSIYLKEGEILTVQELLYGLMLHSGNDAAVALAIYCGGTQEGFVELMNDKAYRLGLSGTHFANPHGLDSPENYSTSKELAILAAYAMENPVFAQTVSTKTVTAGQRLLKNHNKLLWQLDGCEGVKTGYTKAAGRILVSCIRRDGRRLICVTINAPDDWNDHKQLLNEAYERFHLKTVVKADQCLGQISVLGGNQEMVNLHALDTICYPLADDERVQILLCPPGFVYAPVCQGQTAGVAYICVDGNPLCKVSLYYGQTVERIK